MVILFDELKSNSINIYFIAEIVLALAIGSALRPPFFSEYFHTFWNYKVFQTHLVSSLHQFCDQPFLKELGT